MGNVDVNTQKFDMARELAIGAGMAKNGIGTLSEKTLHAVLKHYYEPDASAHEVKIGRHIADIVGENGIIEIQTQGFDKLRKKLEVFLSVARVTIVYPIARTKYISRIDPLTGDVSARRKSPKTGSFYHSFFELYKIKLLLPHPGLSVHLVLLDLDEYRLDKPGKGWRHTPPRVERVPFGIVDELCLSCPEDYSLLIPESLPEAFTSRDYAAAAKIHLSEAQTALNVLSYVGAVEKSGKSGRLILYVRGGDSV